jgi:iron complex transport system ATP-binding protein
MSVSLIECALTTKRGIPRLHPTSVDFVPGAVTAVIGPNGAGKSTLLALASGLIAPSQGSVRWEGQGTRQPGAKELARLRAVLDQEHSVTFGFTVAEVVSWGRNPWQGSTTAVQDQDIIASALSTVDMEHARNRPINELSGGERKRVHLARIIAQRTPVVFLDEPDADLDLVGVEALDAVITHMNQAGTTVVITSHDLSRVAKIADNVLVVARHRVVAQGAASEVLTGPVLSGAYGTDIRVHWNDRGMCEITVTGKTVHPEHQGD